MVVGHVPRNISVACSAFLRRAGALTCTVTGVRQYSSDLPQGGLEIPCRLTFSASTKEVGKIQKLLLLAPSNTGKTLIVSNIKTATTSNPEPTTSSMAIGLLNVKPDPDQGDCDLTIEPPPIKRCRTSNSATEDVIWLKLERNTLTLLDKEVLSNSMQLNDCHINYCQGLLKKQFPLVGGFISTLIQNTKLKNKIACGIQIIHCEQQKHWIVAVRSDSCHNPIRIYDSLFKTVDAESKHTLMNLFKKVGKFKFTSVNMQIQRGSNDCGLFAIAVATDLAHGNDPVNVIFEQKKMRDHLMRSLESGSLQAFPRLAQSNNTGS